MSAAARAIRTPVKHRFGHEPTRPLGTNPRRRRPEPLRARFTGCAVTPLKVGPTRPARDGGSSSLTAAPRATCRREAARWDIGVLLQGRAQTPAGAKRSDRRDSERRDTEAPRTALERFQSAAARFRLKGSLGFVVEPMLARRAANPSRRRTVRLAAEGLFFHGAKRSAEPTASLRRARPRASVNRRCGAGYSSSATA
jgi:hypothetical protein